MSSLLAWAAGFCGASWKTVGGGPTPKRESLERASLSGLCRFGMGSPSVFLSGVVQKPSLGDKAIRLRWRG